jgi:hypothetical protein
MDPSILRSQLSIALLLVFIANRDVSWSQEAKQMDATHKQLEQLEKDWLAQCNRNFLSSDANMPLKQDAYKQIVALGSQIAPLVVERMRGEKGRGKSSYPSGKLEYPPERLPWGIVLQKITKHQLRDDPTYREQVRDYYREEEPEDFDKDADYSFTSYVPEIAVPRLLDWWNKEGVKQFGQPAEKR